MSLTPRIDKLETNVIINGNFDYWQRGTTRSTNGYLADRWEAIGLGTNLFYLRSTDVPDLKKSTYSLMFDANVVYTPGTNDGINFNHKIEGTFMQPFDGKKFLLSFYFKGSKTGLHSCVIKVGSYTWAYSFTVPVASTWAQYSTVVDLPSHPSASTFSYSTSTFATITFPVLATGTFATSTTGQWVSGNYIGVTGTQTYTSSTSDFFNISRVMFQPIENTSTTLDISNYKYTSGDLAKELVLCQRYYETPEGVSGVTIYGSGTSSNNSYMQWWFKARKRAIPTFTIGNNSGAGGSAVSQLSTCFVSVFNGAGTHAGIGYDASADAEL